LKNRLIVEDNAISRGINFIFVEIFESPLKIIKFNVLDCHYFISLLTYLNLIQTFDDLIQFLFIFKINFLFFFIIDLLRKNIVQNVSSQVTAELNDHKGKYISYVYLGIFVVYNPMGGYQCNFYISKYVRIYSL